MVDGNVCVQCMMGDVVQGWCAVVVSGNQIHDNQMARKMFHRSLAEVLPIYYLGNWDADKIHLLILIILNILFIINLLLIVIHNV